MDTQRDNRPTVNRLICGDALKVLPSLGQYKCLIADPPDNIGLGYHTYNDKMPDSDYVVWLVRCIAQFIKHSEITWVSFNAKWVQLLMYQLTDWSITYNCDARLFIQTFTFGQNCKTDCGNGFRPLLRIMRKGATLYPDAIKVPSWRQLNGDKRAAPGGRVPLDHWDEFPRITGNCKERRPWHPTQLREGMIKRIVDFSTQPGEPVCDVFSGTGTALRAIKDRPVTSIELDPVYCEKIAEEHGLTVETVDTLEIATKRSA